MNLGMLRSIVENLATPEAFDASVAKSSNSRSGDVAPTGRGTVSIIQAVWHELGRNQANLHAMLPKGFLTFLFEQFEEPVLADIQSVMVLPGAPVQALHRDTGIEDGPHPPTYTWVVNISDDPNTDYIEMHSDTEPPIGTLLIPKSHEERHPMELCRVRGEHRGYGAAYIKLNADAFLEHAVDNCPDMFSVETQSFIYDINSIHTGANNTTKKLRRHTLFWVFTDRSNLPYLTRAYPLFTRERPHLPASKMIKLKNKRTRAV